jgi:hypothetical protein
MPEEFITPVPSSISMPVPRPLEKRKPVQDPDRFLKAAKQAAVDNYNEHRRDQGPLLTVDQVYIVTYAKALGNWQASVSSPVARGLMWIVNYNGYREELAVTCYKNLSNTKVSIESEEQIMNKFIVEVEASVLPTDTDMMLQVPDIIAQRFQGTSIRIGKILVRTAQEKEESTT